MNVIFLDFDGVISTIHCHSNEDIERRIKLLAEICQEFNCFIVIEASAKNAIDNDTLKINPEAEYVNLIFKYFKKYGIKCIGRTPNVRRKDNNPLKETEMWKEDEIRLYLYRNPEIDHYCIIDDDDLNPNSDLNKVRNHLVKTKYYSHDYNEEGLLPKHKKEIEEVLNKENEIKKLVIKKKNKLK